MPASAMKRGPPQVEGGRAGVLLRLQRSAGNASVCRMLARAADAELGDPEAALLDVRAGVDLLVAPHRGGDAPEVPAKEGAKEGANEGATGGAGGVPVVAEAERVPEPDAAPGGAGAVGIAKSVGRGGQNADEDVAVVSERLGALGVPNPGKVDLDGLGAAIARYQADALGWTRPDGRADPGGRTITALGAGTRLHAKPDVPDTPTADAKPPVTGGTTTKPPAPTTTGTATKTTTGTPQVAPLIQVWATLKPTDNAAVAQWILDAEPHGFAAFTARTPAKGQAASTVDPKAQMQAFTRGETVVEAKSATGEPLLGALAAIRDVVGGRAKRWLAGTSTSKSPLQIGWVVRDDRATGVRGHTYGESADLGGGIDWAGSKGPAQVIELLEDLEPGKYGIGLPFQGDFFPKDEWWVTRALANEAAAGKDGTPADVTEISLDKWTTNQVTAGWRADRKPKKWKATKAGSGAAIDRMKSAALRTKISELNRKGYTIYVFPDNDAHIHITRT